LLVNGAAWNGANSTGNVWYVDSNASGGTYNGLTPATAFQTLAAAISAATASNGDTIILMEGHAETYTAAAPLNINKAGLNIVGHGVGSVRPTFTSGTATGALVNISVATIYLENVLFVCGIDAQTVMVEINAADCTLFNCEFRDGAAATPVTFVDIGGAGANACDRARIINCSMIGTASSNNHDYGIYLSEVANDVRILNNLIEVDADDAAIYNVTGKVMTNLLIAGNVIRQLQALQFAIELVSACTGIIVDNRVTATSGEPFAISGGSCVILNNSTALSNSLIPDGSDGWVSGVNTITFVAGTTGAVATHEIFTVTGSVRLRLLPLCTTDLVGAGTIVLGVEGATNAFIASTNSEAIDANEFWLSATPAALVVANSSVLDFNIAGGLDVGYEIASVAASAGVISFYYAWKALSSNGAVVAADGTGTL
jgi:hypothetical protein